MGKLRAARDAWTGAADRKALGDALASHACVPTRGGALRRPRDLFDPTVPFGSLLDPNQHFPAPPFDAGERLADLKSLGGARSTLGAEGALAAARAVAEGSGADAVARGRALLAYLNALAERTSARANDPGGGGGGGGGGDSGLPPEDATVEDVAASGGTASFWRELANLAWCPALAEPPDDAMPRPGGSAGRRKNPRAGGDMLKGGGYRPHPLAPPRAVRPPEMAWACSASMRVLDLEIAEATTTRGGGGEKAAGGKREEEGEARAREEDGGAREEEGSVSKGFREAPEEAIAETSAAGNEAPEAPAAEEDFSAEEASEASAEEASASASASASSASSLPPSAAPRLLALSPLLVERLGWGSVSPAVIAAQLLELGELHPRVSPDSALARALAGALPAAYASLASASDPSDAACARDGGATLDAVATILDGARWLWTGAGFAASRHVAKHSPADLAPYLHGVPAELASRGALLDALGVRDAFEPMDFFEAANRLAKDSNAPGAEDSNASSTGTSTPTGGGGLSPDRLALAASLAECCAASLRERGDATTLASGAFFLPDRRGVMAPARELARNDAEWLLGEDDEDEEGEDGEKEEGGEGDAKEVRRKKKTPSSAAAGVGALRLVHASVSHAAAERLGSKSLREMYAVDSRSTSRLACPDPRTLRKLLPLYDDSSFFLWDLFELADAAGASSVRVTLDCATYAARSLLEPRLAEFQGPAVVFEARGVGLAPDELARAFSSAAPFPVRSGHVRSGNGLVSCAHRADVVQACTTHGGGRMCVFDPAGVALVSNASGGGGEGGGSNDRRTTGGAAKSFSYAGGELCARFADQFAPFVAAGLRTPQTGSASESAESAESTFIRLPLRTRAQAERASALVGFAADDVDAQRLELAEFAAAAHRALLFSSGVRRARCVVANASGGSSAELLVDVRRDAMRSLSKAEAQSPGGGATSTTPWNAVHDKEWRRSTLTSFFGGGGTSTRVARSVVLTERAGGDAADSDSNSDSGNSGAAATTTTDEWIVGAAVGVGRARDLALDRTNARLALVPLAQTASHARRDGDPVDPAAPPPRRRRADSTPRAPSSPPGAAEPRAGRGRDSRGLRRRGEG